MKSRLIVICSIMSLLVISAIYVYVSRSNAFDYGMATNDQAEAWFDKKIRNKGAHVAYQEFATSVNSVSIDRQHVFAHVFGKIVYELSGIEGFAVCDTRFMYGCFHEIMGRIISEQGLQAVPDVFKRCTDLSNPRPFACLHGIGHGIIASVGYTTDGLHRALTACKTSSPEKLTYWCYGGVFMEYNQRTMLGNEFVRPLVSEGNLYEPCASVDATYKKACIFEQVPWWYRVLYQGDSSSSTFAKLGGLCEHMSASPSIIRTCFEGLGNIVTPVVQYDPVLSRQLCDASTKNDLYRLFCISMAAQSLSQGVHDMKGALEMCDGMIGEKEAFCVSYAKKESTIVNPLRTPIGDDI